MNWFSNHYQWIVGVVVVPVALIFLKRWLSPSQKPAATAALKAENDSSVNSLLASGSGNTQMLNAIQAEHVHIGPVPSTPIHSELPRIQKPLPNIQYIAAETVSLEEVIGGGLVERGSAQNAIVIRFRNEARRDTSTVGVSVKALLIYRDGLKEIHSVTGFWLEKHSNTGDFRVDERLTLIAGILNSGELVAIETEEQRALANRIYFRPDPHPLKDFKTGTLFVRLTAVYTGHVLYEGRFKVTTNPLSIVLQQSASA